MRTFLFAIAALFVMSLGQAASDASGDLSGTWKYAPEKPDRSYVGSFIAVEQTGGRVVIKQGWTLDKPFIVTTCPVDGSACALDWPQREEGVDRKCKLESQERRLVRTCTATTKRGAEEWVRQEGLILELAADRASMTVTPTRDTRPITTYRFVRQ